MFAGIVEGTGRVVQGRRLTIDLGELAEGVEAGDSVAVDGVCLTTVDLKDNRVSFDIMAETLRKTTLGHLSSGSRINIERSLRASDRIEGHLVQGHVQGVGEIIERKDDAGEIVLWIRPPAKLLKFITSQGSIAVNGVSLTVAQLKNDAFAVALVPTTLKLTNLGDLDVGGSVNIETDMIARQVVRYLESTRA